MRVYGQIKELMCDELEHLSRRELTPSSLDVIDKAVDIIKDIDEITEKEEGYSYGMSFAGQGGGNSTRYGMYPIYGNSFERGRQRDSMGRYSGAGNSMGGYYMAGSNTKEELKRLMEAATNETEKEAIRVAIESMNN